jgi:hypothetical protein
MYKDYIGDYISDYSNVTHSPHCLTLHLTTCSFLLCLFSSLCEASMAWQVAHACFSPRCSNTCVRRSKAEVRWAGHSGHAPPRACAGATPSKCAERAESDAKWKSQAEEAGHERGSGQITSHNASALGSVASFGEKKH